MRGKPSTRGLQGTRRRIIPAHAGQTTSGLPGSVTSSDHPRACGANVEMHASLGSHVGSSPRMRGKLRQQLHVPELFRIIPAHAGQTVSIVPRSFASRFAGSSPRMRGKLLHAGLQLAQHRIIPAHAGQTDLPILPPLPNADHPRACGANVGRVHVHELQCGSSPRMRGKPTACRRSAARMRIIPAHAGQTVSNSSRTSARSDHPRACGANVGRVHVHELQCGSSPRMRGKPTACRRSAARMRIIPAHAGQTVSNSSRTSARSDHPRACGANPALSVMTAAPAGSSPRMRGKLGFGFDSFRQRRIIPAHAGQTSRTPTPTPTVSDHPRACGANAAAGRIRTLRRGSSPRMRGKQGGRRKLEREIRIIPAHAGQTAPARDATSRSSDHPRACGANSCSCSA